MNIIQCKYVVIDKYWIYMSRRCTRHAPVAVANPKFRGFEGDTTCDPVVTQYPLALCPCGDYELNEEGKVQEI